MIIFSDVHLREESEEVVLGQVLPGILEAAQQRQDFEIACLGDFWHFRYKIDARIQNRVRDELRRWVDAGMRIRILPGNHDQYNVAGRNALEVFHDIEAVTVYTEPVWDKDGLWIPYRKRPEDIAQAFQTPRMARSVDDVAFLHHGVRGAWMNDNIQDTEGLPLEMFSQFQTVICGHYHRPHQVGNVYYVGSPYQTRADEAGQPKGYAVWDGETLEHVPMQWGRRYHNLEISGGDLLANLVVKTGVRPDDILRVKVKSGGDPEAVGRFLAEHGYQNAIVTPEVEPMQRRLQVGEHAAMSEYARAFVEQTETPLDKQRLMQVFEELRA